jgi:hypothetical protein
MLWPALRALAAGELSDGQVSWLREEFGLTEGPRTEPPAPEESVAHRRLTDDQGVELILDVARMSGDTWEFVLFQASGDKPSTAFVETQRAAFRAAIDHLGLQLVAIDPPATADEAPFLRGDPEFEAQAAVEDLLPDDLDGVWRHLGLRADAPREVKEGQLRGLMEVATWGSASPNLRLQAQEFLDEL